MELVRRSELRRNSSHREKEIVEAIAEAEQLGGSTVAQNFLKWQEKTFTARAGKIEALLERFLDEKYGPAAYTSFASEQAGYLLFDYDALRGSEKTLKKIATRLPKGSKLLVYLSGDSKTERQDLRQFFADSTNQVVFIEGREMRMALANYLRQERKKWKDKDILVIHDDGVFSRQSESDTFESLYLQAVTLTKRFLVVAVTNRLQSPGSPTLGLLEIMKAHAWIDQSA